MSEICTRLGQADHSEQAWLVLTPRADRPAPAREAFPRPTKRPDGSYIYEKIPSQVDNDVRLCYFLFMRLIEPLFNDYLAVFIGMLIDFNRT